MEKDFILSVRRLRVSALQWMIFLYGLMYIIAIIPAVIEPFTTNNIIVNSAFFLFIAGFYISWVSDLASGIIFIIWWGLKWYLGVKINSGVTVALGGPVFIIGIMMLDHWYRRRFN